MLNLNILKSLTNLSAQNNSRNGHGKSLTLTVSLNTAGMVICFCFRSTTGKAGVVVVFVVITFRVFVGFSVYTGVF